MDVVKKLSAVYVDDDCDDLELLLYALKKTQSFSDIHCFESVVEALAFLEDPANIPDLIITDLHLSDMNGLGLLASVRTNPFLAQVPVLIYTGSVNPQDIADTRDGGANGYILKPRVAEHYESIAQLIATLSARPLPWVLDGYVKDYGS